jgi:hypothetical protein
VHARIGQAAVTRRRDGRADLARRDGVGGAKGAQPDVMAVAAVAAYNGSNRGLSARCGEGVFVPWAAAVA